MSDSDTEVELRDLSSSFRSPERYSSHYEHEYTHEDISLKEHPLMGSDVTVTPTRYRNSHQHHNSLQKQPSHLNRSQSQKGAQFQGQGLGQVQQEQESLVECLVLIVHGIGDQDTDNPPFVASLERCLEGLRDTMSQVFEQGAVTPLNQEQEQDQRLYAQQQQQQDKQVVLGQPEELKIANLSSSTSKPLNSNHSHHPSQESSNPAFEKLFTMEVEARRKRMTEEPPSLLPPTPIAQTHDADGASAHRVVTDDDAPQTPSPSSEEDIADENIVASNLAQLTVLKETTSLQSTSIHPTSSSSQILLHAIEWHSKVQYDAGWADLIKPITLPGVQALRNTIRDTLGDVMLFLSPKWNKIILDAVAKQLNDHYEHVKSTRKYFSGKVVLFCHSLGTVIVFELIRDNRLHFPIHLVFNCGSPLGAYLTLQENPTQLIREVFLKPDAPRFVNVFHELDPVATRIEPLLEPQAYALEPIPVSAIIDRHKKKNWSFGSAINQLKRLFTKPAIKDTDEKQKTSTATNNSNHEKLLDDPSPKTDAQGLGLTKAEKETQGGFWTRPLYKTESSHRITIDEIEPHSRRDSASNDKTYLEKYKTGQRYNAQDNQRDTSKPIGVLKNLRYDYQIPSPPNQLEALQYFNAFTSHFQYWSSKEVSHLFLYFMRKPKASPFEPINPEIPLLTKANLV